MKKVILSLFTVFSLNFLLAQEENTTENIGDNFSLEGALAMFKTANSLEEFEKVINEENNSINNLDLNDDGSIDYIMVDDIKEGDTHVLVLSTYLNEKEKQDIATIGIEKTGNENAQLQIVGDEDLYGKDVYVEPVELVETVKDGKGPSIPEFETKPMLVNVWLWPCVRFIYAPTYIVWRSPYRWGYYPRGWEPWKPIKVLVFKTRCAPHHTFYHRTPNHRIVLARKIYTPRRNHGTIVIKNGRRTTVVHKNRRGKTTVVKTKTRGRR